MRRALGLLLTGLLVCYPLWVDVAVFSGGRWRLHNTIGVAVMIPSYVLWMVARWQLGDAFTIGAEARSLVTRGLYRKVRHPVYIAGGGVVIGIAIYVGFPILALALCGLAALQVGRARREERILEQAFGEEYRAYRRQTWF